MAQFVVDKAVMPLGGSTRITAPVGTSLDEIAGKVFPAINDNSPRGETLRAHVVIMIGGVEVPQVQWARTKPKADTEVRVALRAGGDLGQVFQTVLTVVIAVVATYFGVPKEIAWAVASLVSSLITTALIKPPKVDRGESSKYYTIEGARNQLVQLNEPFPLVLGEHRIFPKFLAPPIQDVQGRIYI